MEFSVDIVDIANEQTLNESAQSLEHMKKTFVKMKPNGLCRYCEEEIKPDHLFCDIWCRDQFDDEQRRRQMTGLR